jgi:hypothetical protein
MRRWAARPGVVQCCLVRPGGVAAWRDPVEVGPEHCRVPLVSGTRRGLVFGDHLLEVPDVRLTRGLVGGGTGGGQLDTRRNWEEPD